MTIVEHLSAWQSLLNAIVPASQLLWGALVVLVFWTAASLPRGNSPNPVQFFYKRLYQARIRPLNRMLIAFSNGILHPKRFAA